MKKVLLVFGLVVAFVGIAGSVGKTSTEISDEQMFDLIVRTAQRRALCAWPFERLLVRCNNDSNRLCRIACDGFRSNADTFARNIALQVLRDYGDVQQIPFLETCVTNAWHGRTAICILNRIDGFSSNSVARVARFHAAATRELAAREPSVNCDKADSIRDLALSASAPNVGNELRNLAFDYIYTVASNDCTYTWTADEALMKIDPAFKNSKRRLALLRYAQPRVPGPFSPQHLAEEIQKLEAYPEANLPE